MMKKVQINNSGFGLVPVVLAILVVGAIGLAGWFVFDKKETNNNLETTQQSTQQTAATEQTTPDQATPITFDIKEWGVKADINTAVNLKYVMKSGNKTANFSSDQLSASATEAGCGVDGATNHGGGFIQRLAPADKILATPGKDVTAQQFAADTANNGYHARIGDYFYIYYDEQGPCSANANTQQIQKQTREAVKALLKTLRAS